MEEILHRFKSLKSRNHSELGALGGTTFPPPTVQGYIRAHGHV